MATEQREPLADGWVRVEDGLPARQSMVLLHSPCSQRGVVQYGFYGGDGRGNIGWFIQTTIGWEDVLHTGQAVTHWRPLPAPPVVEGGK